MKKTNMWAESKGLWVMNVAVFLVTKTHAYISYMHIKNCHSDVLESRNKFGDSCEK